MTSKKKAFTMNDFVMKKKKKVTQRRDKKTKEVREVMIVQRQRLRVCLLPISKPSQPYRFGLDNSSFNS